MSFAVGYVEPIQYRVHNPIALDTVLEALRATSKGQLLYPEPVTIPDLLDDVCDSKYIGDFAHIINSLDFRDEVSFLDTYNDSISIFVEQDTATKTEYKQDLSIDAGDCEEYPCSDTVDGHTTSLFKGSEWTSYRSIIKSPVKSPESSDRRHTAASPAAEEDPPWEDTTHEVGDELHRDVEGLLSRLQIDQSLPAVLARVKQYQSAYVARVAAIHSCTMAELERCKLEQQQRRQVERQHDTAQQQQLQSLAQQHTDTLLARKAAEAGQRKAELLAQLEAAAAQQREQEALRAAEQQQQRVLLAEREQREEQVKQSERSTLLSGLKESYQQFSSALDIVLQEIKDCEGVELPPETDAELNNTLQQGSSVLLAAEQPAGVATLPDAAQPDADLLHQTADRLAHGITVLHHIRGIIDTKKSGSELSRESSTTSGAPHISLANDNPAADVSLAQAKETFDKLAEVHKNVASISSELAAQNNEMRTQLSRALAIVNQFNNDNASSNRQKLHQLINLVTGSSCDAGGVQVTVSDKQGPAAMYVREQLATRLISLSHDKQVKSQAVYTALMLRLWQVDPLIQHLCLYQLYKVCPYLVPYLPLREHYQTEEEYHRALGYRHKDGGVREALDSYLKRMGAAGQLYGRIVSIDVENSPVGIHHGWNLLSRLLLCPAQSAVTCSVLHGFLSTGGAKLVKTYGQQFHKLMAMIVEKFLPLLEEVTKEGGEADLASLKTLLSNYFTTKTIPPPPEGYRALL